MRATFPSAAEAVASRPRAARERAARRTRSEDAARRRPRRRQRLLARYIDRNGRVRELVARAGAAESTLVIDRLAGSGSDRRLVAHLAADEPLENAKLISQSYIEAALRGCRCRALTREDVRAIPLADHLEPQAQATQRSEAPPLEDAAGSVYALERLQSGMSIDELRWRRRRPGQVRVETVSAREVIASLERYEPVCAQTARALRLHERSGAVSVATLRSELARVHASPIVLNRGLREAVLERVGRGELSMSEIAIRCGRVKRDRRGNESGETSWLARRLGILAEGGHSTPTPWVHSDVLALIARDGLGVSPREVEL